MKKVLYLHKVVARARARFEAVLGRGQQRSEGRGGEREGGGEEETVI